MVDNYSTFGIKKVLSKSAQYLPKLLINKDLIPATKTAESFEYLGCHFDFNMTNQKHKSKLISLIDELLSEINLKPLHQKNKILAYSRYVLSKLSWHFREHSFFSWGGGGGGRRN
jgi:hypothetical protein